MTRVQRLLRANIHDALDRAEDPAKIVNYLILEMQESLEQAREQTAVAMAAERRLAQQVADAEQAALQWEERARHAVGRGDDDLAREALRRRLAAVELIEQYRGAHREQAQAVAELRTTLDRLQQRLHEAKARRVTLLAQLEATKAQQVVARSLRQTVGQDAFETFDRLAGKIAMDRHTALAITDLSRDDTDDAFVVAEEAGMIEQQLTTIKQELGQLEGPAEPRALDEPGRTADAP